MVVGIVVLVFDQLMVVDYIVAEDIQGGRTVVAFGAVVDLVVAVVVVVEGKRADNHAVGHAVTVNRQDMGFVIDHAVTVEAKDHQD